MPEVAVRMVSILGIVLSDLLSLISIIISAFKDSIFGLPILIHLTGRAASAHEGTLTVQDYLGFNPLDERRPLPPPSHCYKAMERGLELAYLAEVVGLEVEGGKVVDVLNILPDLRKFICISIWKKARTNAALIP